MLHIDLKSAGYGGPHVLCDVRFDLDRGKIVALLGRNGVGKSTLVKAIIGLLPKVNGRSDLSGVPITGLATHRIARLGIGYVPQGRGIFPKLTVLENLQTGTRAAGAAHSDIPDAVFSYFPVLKNRLSQHGGTMSGGEQQMLAIARALCGRPKVLLMDEPTDGVQPSIVDMLAELIPQIARDTATSVLLIEQNLDLALSVAERCLVMDKGTIVHEGMPGDFQDPALLTRFLAV